MTDIARTVEDVRRLAPTAGFYWVGLSPERWAVVRLGIDVTGMRGWWTYGKAAGFGDGLLVGLPIHGPLTPPEAP